MGIDGGSRHPGTQAQRSGRGARWPPARDALAYALREEAPMSVVALAVVIVAAFAGGGAYFLSARWGAGAWLAFTLGLLVYTG